MSICSINNLKISSRIQKNSTNEKVSLYQQIDKEDDRLREEIAEMNRIQYEKQLQERINRMNCAREKQRREDSEFNRRKTIQMFINNCDLIRPQLRKILLKDSKICQLEQINDNLRRKEEMQDLNKAWKEIGLRTYQMKTDKTDFMDECHMQREIRVQEFLKQQMYDKIKFRQKKKDDETDKELEWIRNALKEKRDEDENVVKKKIEKRNQLAYEIQTQISSNMELKRRNLQSNLNLERILNENARENLEKENYLKKVDSENFREEVFQYLEHLREVKKEISQTESEKEKLIEDQRKKMSEEDLNRIIKFQKKRNLVNDDARRIQFAQMQRIDQQMIEQKVIQKQEDFELNQIIDQQRKEIQEKAKQKQIEAERYGKFLMEQIKDEMLRKAAEKQKLEERVMLVEQERIRHENLGREFVESYEDVLPLHPNLKIIHGFNQNHV